MQNVQIQYIANKTIISFDQTLLSEMEKAMVVHFLKIIQSDFSAFLMLIQAIEELKKTTPKKTPQKRRFKALKIDSKSFRFNREEANER